jgi:hypothetical protein
VDIENLDIYFARAPGDNSYTAQVVTAAGAGTDMLPMSLNDPQLLGATPLLDVFAPGTGAAAGGGTDRGGLTVMPGPDLPEDSRFVKALRALQRGTPGQDAIVTVGDGLYNALPRRVSDIYNQMWGRVQEDGDKLLRVRLHFNQSAPELAMLPWEFIRIGDTFLGNRRQQSLIRYPEFSERPGRLGVTGTLKILIWTANPPSTARLDFTQEIEEIRAAVTARLGNSAQIDVVRYGGPRDLLDKLSEGYHVLHYIGHGAFDRQANPPEGKLLFERTEGAAPTLVPAGQLAPSLLDNATLQLVFLNSCQGATGSVTSAYASLAFNLARYVPAVIAMQYRVQDQSAIIFAQEFYRALSRGDALDQCVTRGRNALIAEYGPAQIDWGVPALFTRAITSTVTRPAENPTTPANNTPTNTPATPTTPTANTGERGMDGILRRDLVNLLVQAFPSRADIAMLANFYLNTVLETIPTAGSDIRSLFDGIITWCLSQGGDALARLMDGAIGERPARQDLKEMRTRLVAAGLITSDTGGSGAPQPNVTTPPQPAPTGFPAIEPPRVAEFQGGNLRLTAPGRRLLTNTLASVNWTTTADGRGRLLANLPPNLQGIVRRDTSSARVDLGLMIESVESFGQLSSGKYALILLVETAADQSGFDPQNTTKEAGTFMAFANALRDRVGLPPATEPLAD